MEKKDFTYPHKKEQAVESSSISKMHLSNFVELHPCNLNYYFQYNNIIFLFKLNIQSEIPDKSTSKPKGNFTKSYLQ
jgi:hypothetical protein